MRKKKITAITRACSHSIDRWQLKPAAIQFSEARRRITVRVGRKEISKTFLPYTPRKQIIGWISRIILSKQIEVATKKKEKFDRDLKRKQKTLF